MLGLIKKDLLMVKGNLKVIAIIVIVFLLMSLKGETDFAFIPAFISMMAMTTTFSYDEYNKCDALIKTFPNGCKNSVRAKYIATLLVIVLSGLLTLIISLIVGKTTSNLNFNKVMEYNVGCIVSMMVIQSIIYPFIYKFGIEKCRIGIFAGTFVITALASIFMKYNVSLKIPSIIITLFTDYRYYIGSLCVILVLISSYKVSTYIYSKKEF